MKKTAGIMLIVMALVLGGCTRSSGLKNRDITFYAGQGETWMATYSISNVDSIYYDSLTIQHIFDEKERDAPSFGPIEYELTGGIR